MADLNLTTFDKLYPMIIHKYNELFDDQNASVMDRINTIVDYLNQVGKLTNDVVKDWNTVYNWVMNDGLSTDLTNAINSGKFNAILTTIYNSELGDLTTLQTVDKSNLVAAINDNVASLAQKASQSDLTDITANIKTNGAKTDGSNSKTAIQNTITSSKEVIIPNGTFTTTDEVVISSTVHLEGKRGSQISNTNTIANGDINVQSDDVTLERLNVNGQSTVQGVYTGSVKRFKVKKSTLVSAKHAIHINSANVQDVEISHNDINASGYGILTNANAKNGTNINILFNKIYSSTRDAVELNNPSTSITDTWKQAKIIGNTLTADITGTDTNSGFAIGIAKTRDVVVLGNIVGKSRLESLHIEDDQENVVVSGNVFNGCVADGAHILNGGASGTGQAKPVIVTNNHFTKDQIAKTGTGIYRVFDGSGSLESVLANNHVRGFDKGLWIDGSAFADIDGCIVEDCNTAVKVGANASIVGKVYAKNTPTLLELTNGSIMDRIIAKAPITNLYNYVGTTGQIGATIKGFSFPTPTSNFVASGYTDIALFKMPNILNGKLQLQCNGGANFFNITTDITYDGTTLTTSNLVKLEGGIFGGITLTIVNGNLNAHIFTASALGTAQGLSIDFNGIYYVQS